MPFVKLIVGDQQLRVAKERQIQHFRAKLEKAVEHLGRTLWRSLLAELAWVLGRLVSPWVSPAQAPHAHVLYHD